MSNLDKFQSKERDSRLDSLFENSPVDLDLLVKLPSLGKFYKIGRSSILIGAIKFEDEKQLTLGTKNGINPINLILSKCVREVDFNELLLVDKMLLLLKIREISYGATYPASVICNKCKVESEIEMDLSKLLITTIPEDLEDPREILLPLLNKKIKVRFPRVKDEEFLNSQEQIYSNIWRFVTSLDGVEDPVFISKAIPRMHIRDIKTILKNIMRSDLGLDPKFIFECANCGGETEMVVPINESFFSVT